MKKIWNKLTDLKRGGVAVMFQAFVPLAPVEVREQSGQLVQLYGSTDFTLFFQRLFFFALSLGAIIAVVRLMWAGYLYMGQDMWGTKQKAKDIFVNVIFGLLLLLALVLILRTINMQLLNLDILSSITKQPTTGLTAPPSAQATRDACAGNTSYCDKQTGQNLINNPTPTAP